MGKQSLTEAGYKVILALQINGALNDYVCTFVVNKVDVTEKEQQPQKKSEDKTGSRRGGRRGAF